MQRWDERLSRRRALAWVAVALGVLLVAYALFSGDSAEERVRRAVAAFGATLTVDSGESPLIATARVRGALDELTVKEVSITLPDFPSLRAGRDGLVDALGKGRVLFRTAEVEFSEVQVELRGDVAEVSAVGTLTGVDRHGRSRHHQRQVQLELVKEDGWRVKRVAVGVE